MPFSCLSPEEFDPVIRRIGKDFLLISVSDGERVNTMTASWGGVGYFWNRPVALCMIRPQRYTYGLVEKTDRLSLSFLNPQSNTAPHFPTAAEPAEGTRTNLREPD